jgi:serine/threonine protein kinase
MGRVYAGVELSLGREVAIKTLLPGANPERFVTEAGLTARLSHPGIPPVYALGTTADGRPFLAMKLIRGRTLADLLKGRSSPADDLPRFVQIFEQVAQAVAYAHTRGVIHRDLKPSNVMVGEFGEVQVMDWGLAREVGAAEPTVASPELTSTTVTASTPLTATGAVLGTPGYMPPEQARGEPLGPAADVFALGSVLAQILTGRPAFTGDNTWDVVFRTTTGDLADALDRLERCAADPELVAMAVRYLAENPDRRPATAGAVAAEVAAHRAGVEHRLRKAEADARERAVRDGERRKRQRVLIGAGGVVAAALMLGVTGTSVGMIMANAAAEAEKSARQDAQRRLNELSDIDSAMQSVLNEFVVSEVFPGPKPDPLATGRRLDALTEDVRRRFAGSVQVRTAALNFLANGYSAAGSEREAGELYGECLRDRSAAFGPEHLATLQAVNNWWTWVVTQGEQLDAAEAGMRANLADCRRRLGTDHSFTLTVHNNLAFVLLKEKKFGEAEAEARTCLADRLRVQGENYPQVLDTRSLVAAALEGRGRFAEAIAEWRTVWDTATKLYGPDGTWTSDAWDNIDRLYGLDGRAEERAAWRLAHPQRR